MPSRLVLDRHVLDKYAGDVSSRRERCPVTGGIGHDDTTTAHWLVKYEPDFTAAPIWRMSLSRFKSTKDVYDFLDYYAEAPHLRAAESGLGGGLITSYWLDYHAHDGKRDGATLKPLLESDEWHIRDIGDGQMLYVEVGDQPLGFAEAVSDRHLLIHSVQQTKEADAAVRKRVTDSADLDFAWLPGNYLEELWRTQVLAVDPNRTVKMKFEHRAQFDVLDDFWGDVEGAEDLKDHPSSTSEIKEPSSRLSEIIGDLQEIHAPFKAISMLRIPSHRARGGYDLWSWGKLTYRAERFRRGRTMLDAFSAAYARLVSAIEERLWFYTEAQQVGEGRAAIRLHGAPLTLRFGKPLEPKVFAALIDATFVRGQGPLQLWGNPLWAGPNRVHVYGIDKHLWQRINLELTPFGITAVLPSGTCGNTVNRLITNIQRYVSPSVEAWVGETPYQELLEAALAGDPETAPSTALET